MTLTFCKHMYYRWQVCFCKFLLKYRFAQTIFNIHWTNFFEGLDDQKDKILEIACLITDTNLKLVAEVMRVALSQGQIFCTYSFMLIHFLHNYYIFRAVHACTLISYTVPTFHLGTGYCYQPTRFYSRIYGSVVPRTPWPGLDLKNCFLIIIIPPCDIPT